MDFTMRSDPVLFTSNRGEWLNLGLFSDDGNRRKSPVADSIPLCFAPHLLVATVNLREFFMSGQQVEVCQAAGP